MDSENNGDSDDDYEKVSNAEKMTAMETQSRQNVIWSSVDAVEQLTALEEVLIDGGVALHLMAEGKLVENDNYDHEFVEITSTATMRHQLPFDDLRPQDRVQFSDLASSLNSVLYGKYLLCQTISFASHIDAVVSVVTDPKGGLAMPLALYNYSFGENSVLKVNGDDILPPGSLLVVRNPGFKRSPSGFLILICDNPAEVELVSKKRIQAKFPDLCWEGEIGEKMLKFSQKQSFWDGIEGDGATFEKLRGLGDKGLEDKRYSDALRFYDMALDYCGYNREEEALIQFDKSTALLALGAFAAAIKCAEAALEFDPGNEMCNIHKTKALIGLGQYEEGLSFLGDKFNQFPSLGEGKDCRALLESLKFLCSRKNLGPTENQLLSIRTGTCSVDDPIPEFISPLAAISKFEGKGRGLIATADIHPGQLLICSKAFCFQGKPTISPAILTDKLKRKISNMLTFDPQLAPAFYSLTAGSELGHLEPGDARNRHVYMGRISGIVNANAFSVDRTRAEMGLWLFPSLFNHSCSEHNCSWDTGGEWMTVRAIAEIKKGEELTLAYQSPVFSYEERQFFFNTQGFTCACKLCQLESQEAISVSEERGKILAALGSLFFDCGPLEMEKGCKDVERLISLRNDLNFPLLSPQVFHLMNILMGNGCHGDALPFLTLSFELAASSVCWACEGISLAIDLISCHAENGDEEAAKVWTNTLKALMMKFEGSLELMPSIGYLAIDRLKEHFDIDFFKED